MLDIGLSELLIILAVALIVLGPKKLPEVARSLGRGLAQFRRASEDLRRSILAEDSYWEREDSAEALSRKPSTLSSEASREKAEAPSPSDHEPSETAPYSPGSDPPHEKDEKSEKSGKNGVEP
jgi:Tat protein translocase TatB subunit